jgi:hypothetical protein
MNPNENGTDRPDEEPFDAEFARMMSQTETEIDLERLQQGRDRCVRELKKLQKGTLFGALESRMGASMDYHDQLGWQQVCQERGRKLYAELRRWALLYQYDLLIEYLKHGQKFPVGAAQVRDAIFQGMVFAGTDWAYEEMGRERPSPRGKMMDDPDVATDR